MRAFRRGRKKGRHFYYPRTPNWGKTRNCKQAEGPVAWAAPSKTVSKLMFNLFRRPNATDPLRGFAEATLTYWFSKHGYKCARVERDGIDLLAKELKTNRLLGISLRCVGQADTSANLQIMIPVEDLNRARSACLSFSATPYFAFHISEEKAFWLFIISQEHLIDISKGTETGIECGFASKDMDRYLIDPQVVSIEMNHVVWTWL